MRVSGLQQSVDMSGVSGGYTKFTALAGLLSLADEASVFDGAANSYIQFDGADGIVLAADKELVSASG